VSDARRRLALVIASGLVVLATVVYLAVELRGRPQEQGPAALDPAAVDASLFFRSTADDDYGQVSFVEAGRQRTSATATSRRCDRIDVLPDRTMVCLIAQVSPLSRSRLSVIRPDGSVVDTWQVPGVPSRVRFSPDGSLVASTTFVQGHSYLQAGFSTTTQVHRVGGGSVDLEDYDLVLEGEEKRPVDRNYWGVTFVDARTFYATLRSGDSTWLVRGDTRDRTLTSLRTDAECPSLSPDGTALVYKKRDGHEGADWTLALLDLRSGDERLLGEQRSVDDQVEWLDDSTVLYAVPHDRQPGRSDVWELGTADRSEPRLLVEDATSPSVVPTKGDGTEWQPLGEPSE